MQIEIINYFFSQCAVICCRGCVENGRREGECSVTCLENGIRMLRASYYNDRPEGFVTLERDDGSWREGFCLDGQWDGLVREFDSERNLKVNTRETVMFGYICVCPVCRKILCRLSCGSILAQTDRLRLPPW